MRTNINIDEQLLNKAMQLSKVKTKKDVIHLALREFVENKKRLNLLDLAGKIKFSENYNYKQMRK
ncbi:MAG TPA: type II toxin-antitoxin system VapB family antitoxin [Calditrichaeota bacterium]|nr:type II toxin-antitoxin system VapB family antitoxin [Calditrichota bacterium]